MNLSLNKTSSSDLGGGVFGVAFAARIDIIEHKFYNSVIAIGVRIRGYIMENEEYRQKIIELINNCNNNHWLKTIYSYIKTLLK